MASTVLNLTESLAIEANSFWSFNLLYPGNHPNVRLRGQIRSTYKGELLATFRFLAPTFEAGTNQTRIVCYLESSATEKIAIPPDGEYWVYDLLLQLPGEDFKRILRGNVAVIPGVTDV